MPSELENQKARKEALLQQAFAAHNSGVQEDKRLRLQSRRELQGLIREQRAAHRKWQEEQQRAADEGGWLAGMMTGAGTGASVGTAIKPGWGTLIGGAVGAIGGGIYGAMEGRQAVEEVSPYAGAVSQLASGYAQMKSSEKQNQQLIDFYTGRGQGQQPGASAGAAPAQLGQTSAAHPTSVPGGVSLGTPQDFQYRERPSSETFTFDFDTSGESFTPEEAQMGYLDQRRGQDWINTTAQTGDFTSSHQYGPKEYSMLSTEMHPDATFPLFPHTGLPKGYTGLTQPYTRKLP